MNAADIDLGVFVRLHNKLTGGLRKTEDAVAKSSDRMNKRLSLSMKLAGAGAVATAIAAASKAINTSTLSRFIFCYFVPHCGFDQASDSFERW